MIGIGKAREVHVESVALYVAWRAARGFGRLVKMLFHRLGDGGFGLGNEFADVELFHGATE